MNATKKLFQMLADTIAARYAFAMTLEDGREHGGRAWECALFARDMADTLAKTNERFDRARFLAACKLSPACLKALGERA